LGEDVWKGKYKIDLEKAYLKMLRETMRWIGVKADF
jgi:hypothetical protein